MKSAGKTTAFAVKLLAISFMPVPTIESGFHEIGEIPALRLGLLGDAPPRRDGQFVVYWMTAARRTQWNFALQRAVGWARELKRPLVVVEVLACGGRWDTDRHHAFVMEGMADNARRLAARPLLYCPYVEPRPGECRQLFAAVCKLACAVVTDDYPIRLPAIETVDPPFGVRVETIDGNGLLPLRAADKAFPTAYAFRRFLQRTLRDHLLDSPKAEPLARVKFPSLNHLPAAITRRWPPASIQRLSRPQALLASLGIDHTVPAAPMAGGSQAAHARWKAFLAERLASYPETRNRPEEEATSGLAPYLHFGHVSAHEMFHGLARHEAWSPDKLAEKATGGREGWWGMSDAAEAFLDQLVTWRELGFNCCAYQPDYDDYESLPSWARATLGKHAADARPHEYGLEEFRSARTHDPLWNAAQRQLLTEGRIHNYLRMLWAKKILHWAASPRDALDILVELNNRYALDGQDPNSYSGIFWTLGRYDRPWGPERPIFGTVRYMSSENTARKVRVADYVARYAAEPAS